MITPTAKDLSRRTNRRSSQDASLLPGAGADVKSSMASASTTATWPFVRKDSGGKSCSSLSSLSSIFDDEEVWAEFKTELEAREIKTGLGIQGMMSKFWAEKRAEQRGPEGGDDTSDGIVSSTNDHHRINGRPKRRQSVAASTTAQLRRLSSNIAMASLGSFLPDPDAVEGVVEAKEPPSYLAVLPGRRSSGEHTRRRNVEGEGGAVLAGRRRSVDHGSGGFGGSDRDIRYYGGNRADGGCGPSDDAGFGGSDKNINYYHASQGETPGLGKERGKNGLKQSSPPEKLDGDISSRYDSDSFGSNETNQTSNVDNHRVGLRDRRGGREERNLNGLSHSCPPNKAPVDSVDGMRLSKSFTSWSKPAVERGGELPGIDDAPGPNLTEKFKGWLGSLKERRESFNEDGIDESGVICSAVDADAELPSGDETYQQYEPASPSIPPWLELLLVERRANVNESINGSFNWDEPTLPCGNDPGRGIAADRSHFNKTPSRLSDRDARDANVPSPQPSSREKSPSPETSGLRDDDVDTQDVDIPLPRPPSHSYLSSFMPETLRHRAEDIGTQDVNVPSSQPASCQKPLSFATSNNWHKKLSDDGTVYSHDTSRLRDVVVQLSQREDAQDLNGSSSYLPPSRPEPSRPTARSPETQDLNGSPRHLLPPRSEPSPPKAYENSDNAIGHHGTPRGARSLQNAVFPPQRRPSHPKRSCLKKSPPATVGGGNSSSSISHDSTEDRLEDSDSDDQGTVQLLNLLLTLDCTLTAGERLAKRVSTSSPPSASVVSWAVQEKRRREGGRRGGEEEETGKKDPFLDLGSLVLGAGAADGTLPNAGQLRYKPKRKHSGRADKPGKRESTKERRKRHVRILHDNVVNKSFNTDTTKPTSGTDGSNGSPENMMSIMSTGSMMDIQERHIPVTNAESSKEAWASIDWSSMKGLADAPPSKLCRPKTINDLRRKIDQQVAPPVTRSYSLQVIPAANSLAKSMSVRRRRNSLQDNAINRHMATGSADGSNACEIALKRNKKSKGKGCMADVQKRYSSDKETATSNIDGNNAVSLKAFSKAQRSPSVTSTNSMLSMMSTGSYNDMKRRHIPTMAAKSKRQDLDRTSTGSSIPTVDWGATSGDGIGLAMQNHPQANVLTTTGSAGARDVTLPIPNDNIAPAVERQKQRRLAVTGNDPLTNQQQTLGDQALLRREAALQRICDLEKPHSERQLSKQALDDSGHRESSTPSDDNIDPITTAVGNCSIDLKIHQTKKSGSNHVKKEAAVESKTVPVHPLPAAKSEEDQSPSVSIPSGRLIGESARKQELTMAEYMRKRHELEFKKAQAREKSTPSNIGSQQEAPEDKSKARNTGCTDLFRRYLENKAKNSVHYTRPTPNKKDGSPPISPKSDRAAAAPRGSGRTSMAKAGGELLVDWGDTATPEDEGDDDCRRGRSGTVENEDRQAPRILKEDRQAPPISKDKKEEESQVAIVWAGSSSVEDPCITVNPHEVALRRVSDITTYDFDGDEDMALMDDYPGEEEGGGGEPAPPSVAFKKKMRSLSIAEEPLEEEEFDDW